jgi:hypothetical protein
MQSFDRGYYLLVKAIQELRERKDGLVVTVGIGGPTGSGKTRSIRTILRPHPCGRVLLAIRCYLFRLSMS